jgi:hypothetical protein
MQRDPRNCKKSLDINAMTVDLHEILVATIAS